MSAKNFLVKVLKIKGVNFTYRKLTFHFVSWIIGAHSEMSSSFQKDI